MWRQELPLHSAQRVVELVWGDGCDRSSHWVTLLTCLCIDSSESNMTQRSRMASTGMMMSFPIFSDSSVAENLLRLTRDPNHINSVFDGFSCRRLAAHQSPLAAMHCCKWSTVDGTFGISLRLSVECHQHRNGILADNLWWNLRVFSVADKFQWPQNRSLRYSTVHDVRAGLMGVDVVELCSLT